MQRLSVLLLLILVGCAMGVIASQHRSRLLYQQLEAERELAQQLDTEHQQLQLELSTWATHPRIDRIAREQLRMHPPELMERLGADGKTLLVATPLVNKKKAEAR